MQNRSSQFRTSRDESLEVIPVVLKPCGVSGLKTSIHPSAHVVSSSGMTEDLRPLVGTVVIAE